MQKIENAMKITLKNAEDLIFMNQQLHKSLPEFRHLFNQWKLAKQVPALRDLGRRTILELLNSLTEKHLGIIGKHYDTEVSVAKMDTGIVKNFEVFLPDAEKQINNLDLDWSGIFSVFRKGDQLYLSFLK